MDRPFADSWNSYADASTRGPGRWPGDEWGDAQLWRAWFDRLFVPAGVGRWSKAIGIGQGGGKQTALAFAAGCREVLACDVSDRFLEVCRERFAPELAAGRLHLRCIDEGDADSLQRAADELHWRGEVDAVFSIDAMVHVEFTAHGLRGDDLRPRSGARTRRAPAGEVRRPGARYPGALAAPSGRGIPGRDGCPVVTGHCAASTRSIA